MWLLSLAHAAPELNVILVSADAREVTVASHGQEHRACAREVPAPSPWWSCSAPDGWYEGPGTYVVTVRLEGRSIQGEIVLDGTEAALRVSGLKLHLDRMFLVPPGVTLRSDWSETGEAWPVYRLHNLSDQTFWAEMDNGAVGRVERRTEAGWNAYPQMAMCGFGISMEALPPGDIVVSTEGRFRGRPDPLPPGEYRYVVPLYSGLSDPKMFEIAAPFTVWEPGKGPPPLEQLPPIAWLAAPEPEGPAE